MLEVINTFSSVSGLLLYGVLFGFIIISYLILALLTWSFIKPLKYLGIPMIIVGIILLIIRSFSSTILKVIAFLIIIPKSIISIIFMPILIMGLIYIALGICFIYIDKKHSKKNISVEENKKIN